MNAQDCLNTLRELLDVTFSTVSANGKPFTIRQHNCLHGGLCAENCPVQAIVRRERERGV